MALKRRNKVDATFAMSSMTDLIFLLLLFFVMASTMSSPNDIKINLPQARAKTNTKQVAAKVFIDNLGSYSVALGREKPGRPFVSDVGWISLPRPSAAIRARWMPCTPTAT